MATLATIVTVVMGFGGALLLLYAGSNIPNNKRGQIGDMSREEAYRKRQRTMRRLGISAAIVAVIAAYVAAFSA